ncbi:uncharacterized protein LY89DRAFT_160576 [Mollisia scopiformis]|uniref:Zn(2)-C6 fungal-type domain-containing protein n=1 Tax=Mollisia scopiformis TaxID=149040 RepID=A0A194X079_MOLSC|nr:uncharacterized protein LY89DRAFT_160576 [Mollisia scopiformis]KUJ13598.1 hypothetical protein LY89DRAFT_160576 [Mollisia scopiformis]
MNPPSTNALRPGDTQAHLACERCKRRKIKCDRVLPTCRTCLKSSESCSYPLVSHKPGPKPGVQQRRRNRSTLSAPAAQPRSLDENEVSHRTDNGREISIPAAADLPSTDIDRSASRGLALSQLIHPSHEPISQYVTQNPAEVLFPADTEAIHIREALGLSATVYQNLIDAYFDNITAFSLFHRPTFEKKVSRIRNPLHSQALLTSIFSLSARYTNSARPNDLFQNEWLPRARRLVDESLRECSDDVPPLCLLQAMILTTFQELINGVRGCAWRSVGTCVRIAYELQLHLIDKNPQRSQAAATLEEEKRRAWWVIWEFDVFACAIRRLPTAIDWTQNETWLPIDDEIWFANACAKSCTLDPDPAVAWKTLQASGNRSPKAWFIVVNALMRCAHILSYPQSYANGESPENVRIRLEVLANSLFCLTAALPSEAIYEGEFLTFSTCPENRSSFQLDGAKHSIHIMTQLSRFMINHYQVFDSTSRRLALVNDASAATTQQAAIDDAAWTHYLGAASEIVKLVRGCAPKHVNYVNPFLASTVWLAAATQIVSKAFSTSSAERRVAASNLDVLQMNLNAFVEILGVSKNLQQKLVSLEAKLAAFKEQARNDRPRQNPQHYTFDSRSSGSFIQGQMTPDSMSGNPIHQQTQTLNPAFASGTWPVAPNFDWTDPSMNTELSSNLWGWGVDELLQYGVT